MAEAGREPGSVDHSQVEVRAIRRPATSVPHTRPFLGGAELPGEDRTRSAMDEGRRAVGALLIAIPLAPVLGAILSVLSLAAWVPRIQVTGAELMWAALANLVIAWVVLAAIAWVLGLSTARGALPGTYGELVQGLAEIRAWLEHLNTAEAPSPSLYARTAYSQLAWQYRLIERELGENGARWFVGTGYVNVWRRVHEAQEVLLRLVSEDALPAAARHELLRFAGSAISGSDDAVQQLQSALAVVDSQPSALVAAANPTTPVDREQARDVIQTMRMKVDQYRDKARSGLTRSRSDVTRTLTMTALLSYALFWIAIQSRLGYELGQGTSSTDALAAVQLMANGAMVLFLWGALVGLFGQLWTKWNANPDTGEDDFGLGISRIFAEPVLAGVAGMCGVVVLTFGGPLLVSGLSGLSGANAAASLATAFLPWMSPASLLYAAVFALSPNLLISRLQAAGANLQKNLSTSSAGDGGGMASTSKSPKS